MTDYAYSVSAKIALENGAAMTGLGAFIGKLLGAHAAVNKLNSSLKTLAMGYGFDKIGGGILGFMKTSLDHSKEYQHELSLINVKLHDHAEAVRAISQAWKTARDVPTSSVADNLRIEQELAGVLPNMKSVYSVLSDLQRTSAIVSSQSGRNDPNIQFAMIKYAIDTNRGALTEEALKKSVEMQGRALLAFPTISADDMFTAAKGAKLSAINFSDEYKYMIFPALISELKSRGAMGGSTAGTLTNRLTQMIQEGKISQSLIHNWIDAGGIDVSKIVKNTHGLGYRIDPGAIIGSGGADFDIYKWTGEYGEKLVKNLMASKHITEQQAIGALAGDAMNKEFGLGLMIEKRMQFERSNDWYKSMPTQSSVYGQMLDHDPNMASEALQNQWGNLTGRIGADLQRILIPAMTKLADILDSVASLLRSIRR